VSDAGPSSEWSAALSGGLLPLLCISAEAADQLEERLPYGMSIGCIGMATSTSAGRVHRIDVRWDRLQEGPGYWKELRRLQRGEILCLQYRHCMCGSVSITNEDSWMCCAMANAKTVSSATFYINCAAGDFLEFRVLGKVARACQPLSAAEIWHPPAAHQEPEQAPVPTWTRLSSDNSIRSPRSRRSSRANTERSGFAIGSHVRIAVDSGPMFETSESLPLDGELQNEPIPAVAEVQLPETEADIRKDDDDASGSPGSAAAASPAQPALPEAVPLAPALRKGSAVGPNVASAMSRMPPGTVPRRLPPLKKAVSWQGSQATGLLEDGEAVTLPPPPPGAGQAVTLPPPTCAEAAKTVAEVVRAVAKVAHSGQLISSPPASSACQQWASLVPVERRSRQERYNDIDWLG